MFIAFGRYCILYLIKVTRKQILWIQCNYINVWNWFSKLITFVLQKVLKWYQHFLMVTTSFMLAKKFFWWWHCEIVTLWHCDVVTCHDTNAFFWFQWTSAVAWQWNEKCHPWTSVSARLCWRDFDLYPWIRNIVDMRKINRVRSRVCAGDSNEGSHVETENTTIILQ